MMQTYRETESLTHTKDERVKQLKAFLRGCGIRSVNSRRGREAWERGATAALMRGVTRVGQGGRG